MSKQYKNILAYDLILNLKILKLIIEGNYVTIEYLHNYSRINYYIYKLIAFIKRDFLVLKKINFSLGNLYEGKTNLGLKLEFDLPEASKKISYKLKDFDLLKIIPETIKREYLLYIKKSINAEIRPIFPIYLILNWKIKNEQENICLLLPYSPIIKLLDQLLNSQNVKVFYFKKKNPLPKIRKIVSSFIKYGYFIIGDFQHKGRAIGVKYLEGLDIGRRSDIFWLRGINKYKNNLLIYKFFSKDYKKILAQKTNSTKVKIKFINPIKNYKEANQIIKLKKLIKNHKIKDKEDGESELWLHTNAYKFTREALRWVYFIRNNQIKILFDLDGPNSSVCQKAALNLCNSISLGAQRSCITMDRYQPFLHYNAHDIYFTWGSEFKWHNNNSPIIKNFIITGYPFNISHNNNGKQLTISSKKTFCIALFDNGYNNTAPYSKSMMENYYKMFLEWLIEDESIRIIIKSKRPGLVENLDGINKIYKSAMNTGRVTRLSNEKGRFPSDASRFADVAIGIGISSAVIEAVIHGCRGIHCDLAGFNYHYYYKIGYNKLVFDDINHLIETLKLFKKDKFKNNGIGDWSNYIQHIDPYRDKQGDKRIGNYIEWLLDCFYKGMSKDEAIQFANNNYELQWGNGTVFPNKGHRNISVG